MFRARRRPLASRRPLCADEEEALTREREGFLDRPRARREAPFPCFVPASACSAMACACSTAACACYGPACARFVPACACSTAASACFGPACACSTAASACFGPACACSTAACACSTAACACFDRGVRLLDRGVRLLDHGVRLLRPGGYPVVRRASPASTRRIPSCEAPSARSSPFGASAGEKAPSHLVGGGLGTYSAEFDQIGKNLRSEV